MDRRIKLFCILALIVTLITALVVVILNKDDLTKRKDDSVITEETISLLIIEPDFLNPLVSKNKYVQEVSNLVFEGLTRIDEELKPQLILAKAFVPNAALTSWTVTLREDVTFHDGGSFTADDVVFTINKIKELGESSYFSYNVENIKSISKVSDYELNIELYQADNFLINKMNLPILSCNYYKNKSLEHVKDYVGTGPYKQVKVTDSEMKLNAFEDYYFDTTGNIKNIDVKITAKTRPGFELLKVGEIDIADTDIEVGAYGRSAYSNKKYATSIFEGIIFNSNNEALKDNNVRKAILLGINRDLIIENYLGGYGVSVDMPVNPNSYLFNKELQKNSFNPERAQDILTNNGWKENLALGFRNKEALKLEFNLLVSSDSENSEAKANFIKENLKNIGIDITVIPKSSTLYNTAIAQKDYDLALTDWAISEYPEFLYNFSSSSTENIFGFSNEDYDYYVFMAKTEYLEGKSKEYFYKMQEILEEELPIIGLYFETSTVYYKQNIKGELKSTINNIYSGIWDMLVIN